jgi:sulfur carrier protein ThiS
LWGPGAVFQKSPWSPKAKGCGFKEEFRVTIYFKSGGQLREMLKPDIDYYTRKVETLEGQTIREILTEIGVNPQFIAFAYTGGKVKQLDYVPQEGESITLQPPVSGG